MIEVPLDAEFVQPGSLFTAAHAPPTIATRVRISIVNCGKMELAGHTRLFLERQN